MGAASVGPALSGAGSLLGAGASIYGIVQGKNAQEKAQKQLAEILAQQTGTAEAILSQTGPLRSLTATQLGAVLSGGRTDMLRVFAPEREALEQQFTQARESAIATGTPGGMLNRTLANLDIARAQSVAGLESDVRRKAFEDALRVGYGVAPSVSFPAMQGASNTLQNQALLGAQQQAAGGAGLGSAAAIGTLLTMKGQQK